MAYDHLQVTQFIIEDVVELNFQMRQLNLRQQTKANMTDFVVSVTNRVEAEEMATGKCS